MDSERCTGCGACADVCPTGAIPLVNRIATINKDLCQDCQACVTACPQGAICLAEEKVPVVEGEVISVSQALPVVQQPASVPIRPTSWPWSYRLGVALAFLGREVVPRAAAYLLEAWRHKQAAPVSRGRSVLGISPLDHEGGGAHRQRQRQRRGR